MTASPVDAAVNPNDVAQRYVLWGNGRIDNYGGAPPVTGQATWYDSLIPMPVAVAIHITDWAAGAGYMLDLYGGVHAFNGAPDLGQPTGIPYVEHHRNYVDWAWHPSGNGQGYALSVYGQLHHFGGATPAPRQGGRWTQPFAKKLQVSWDGVLRAITLDAYGGLHPDFGAVVGKPSVYWPHRDAARDFVVNDWPSGSGHVLDLHGGVHEFGGGLDTWGWPYNPGGDVARILVALSNGDPQRFWQVWSGGQQYEYVSSTPPGVVAGGHPPNQSPPSVVTTTTRPTLAWAYGDLQGDRQVTWQLLVFTQDFAGTHDMADPFRWRDQALVVAAGSDPTVRGYVADLDFPNGLYVMFVAAQDSAGQWSAWSNYGWAQNVPLPVAPTGLTAVPDNGAFSVTLSVSATTGGSADLVRFEASEDDGATWVPVLGADAVPLAATTTAADRFPGPGVQRTYQAIAYAANPAVASEPSNTATATMTRLVYLLHAIDDPTIGGEVPAVDPSEWVRPIRAGVFEGLSGPDDEGYATVVDDGTPRARRMTLHLITHDRAEWERVVALATARSTLVYRDPFGEVIYCKLAGGDWQRRQLPAAPLLGEQTPLRHMHSTGLPLVEVRPPHLPAPGAVT